jgi:hypothetical protein
VNGSGFKAGEQVTVQFAVSSMPNVLVALTTADAGGSFRLEANLTVPAGAQLDVRAQGDQGSEAPSRQDQRPLQNFALYGLAVWLVIGVVGLIAYLRLRPAGRRT